MPATTPRTKRSRRAPQKYTPSQEMNSTSQWAVSPIAGPPEDRVSMLEQQIEALQQSVQVLAEGQASNETLPQRSAPDSGTNGNAANTSFPLNPTPQTMQLGGPVGIMATKLLPLHTMIPRDVRKAISEGDYVDFHTLKPTFSAKKDRATEASNNRTGKDKSMADYMTPVQWARASLRHSSAIMMDHPEQAQALLVHMEQVLMVAEDGGDWQWYDKQFRLQKTMAPYGYDDSRLDLYSQAMAKPKPRQQLFRAKQDIRVPKGFCINYHVATKRCTANPCIYSHKCFECDKAHPAFLCGKQAPRRDAARDRKADKPSLKE